MNRLEKAKAKRARRAARRGRDGKPTCSSYARENGSDQAEAKRAGWWEIVQQRRFDTAALNEEPRQEAPVVQARKIKAGMHLATMAALATPTPAKPRHHRPQG